MGNCLNGSNQDGDSSGSGRGRSDVPRNQPLRQGLPKWKNESPITGEQLRVKRDEFWDTAPLFEGQKEIWDALKAAAYALEGGDHSLAQAIVDGANITLPGGTLLECYDELGVRYQLPVYALSAPTNIIGGPDDDGDIHRSDAMDEATSGAAPVGHQLTLKLRLSTTGKDVKVNVMSTDTVYKVKKGLEEASKEGHEDPTPALSQRWFYGGHLLRDKTCVEDLKIPRGHLIQVVVIGDTETS